MLTRYNPFTNLEKEIYDLFAFPHKTNWSPSIDVSEDATRILVEAELPGVNPEDVELTAENNTLTIKGKKSLRKTGNKESYLITERSTGFFTRSFSLPSSLEIDKIEANYNKGILTIEIPKQKEKIPKQIKINVSS
jgi:HSP20 family protein